MHALRPAIGLAALAILLATLWGLAAERTGLTVTETSIGQTPATIFTRADLASPAPAVVIAHGFAGSQQLMHPFAVTLARAGYVAITYDLLGHGRNPDPLTGDVGDVAGATENLLAEMQRVADFARDLAETDGRLAILGHSMASDLVVRFAARDGDIAATIAVSLFSPQVTATEPANLLVVTGALEPGLTDEAIRVAALAAEGPAEPFVTYGSHADGTARRAVLSPGVEHVGVLYSATSLDETRAWLDAAFGTGRAGETPPPDSRGLLVLALVAAMLALAWAAAPLLPRVAAAGSPRPERQVLAAGEDTGLPAAPADPVPSATPARTRRRSAWALAILGPALLAPPLALAIPFSPLPAPVADYLALHFAVYGLLTGLALWRLRLLPARPHPGALAIATLALAAYGLLALYLPLDAFVANFVPPPHRLPLLGLLAAGLLPYFLADEALTRHPDAPRLAYPLTKLAFLLSLGLAVALDPGRLFFLAIILPVILLFFLLFGLLSRWSHRATGSPLPAALANTLLFAWAIAVTFPLLG